MGIIANGELLDTLRRVKSFGVPLVRIDIRQESTRHTEALGEMTRYLGDRRLRKLVRGRQTGFPDPRTELQTSAAAAPAGNQAKRRAKFSIPAR